MVCHPLDQVEMIILLCTNPELPLESGQGLQEQGQGQKKMVTPDSNGSKIMPQEYAIKWTKSTD